MRIAVSVLIALVLVAFVFNQPTAVSYATDSDMLLPADLVHSLFKLNVPAGLFRLPHVPSLFPDLTLYIPLQLLSGSWRFATFSVALLRLLTLAAAAAMMQERGHGALTFLLIATAVIGAEIGIGQYYTHLHLITQLVSHSGEFVFTVLMAILAIGYLSEPTIGRLILLFILSSISFVSDPLTLFEFHIPILLALSPNYRGPAGKIIGAVLASIAAGWLFDCVLFSHFLQRDGGALRLSEIGPRLHDCLADLSVSQLLSWPLPVALLFGGAWAWWRGLPDRDPRRLYWRVALAASILPAMAVAALQYGRPPVAVAFTDYVEISWFRYLDGLFWWPLLLLVLMIREVKLAWPVSLAALIGLLCVTPFRLPLLAEWRPSMARCLEQHRAEIGGKSGLASYWNARIVSVGLDWQPVVDQITSDGHPMLWGNNVLSYRSSPDKPDYGFVIMRGLYADEIRRNYGEPAGEISCPQSDVWIYRDDSGIRRSLEP